MAIIYTATISHEVFPFLRTRTRRLWVTRVYDEEGALVGEHICRQKRKAKFYARWHDDYDGRFRKVKA